jgi:hypothetical protein
LPAPPRDSHFSLVHNVVQIVCDGCLRPQLDKHTSPESQPAEKDTAMTAKLFSHTRLRKPVQAAIALVLALGIGSAALATELKSPASKSKLLRDKDVTIIIDKDDDRSSSQGGASGQPLSSAPRQPATKIKRDDDVTIRIKRNSSNGGTIVRSGSKVIIVDKNTSGCNGDGVCIIRP